MTGDTEAHSFDGPELCRKILPRDLQEARGCKVRDMDKRNKCWNKKVYVGAFGGAESFGPWAESDVDLVDDESL